MSKTFWVIFYITLLYCVAVMPAMGLNWTSSYNSSNDSAFTWIDTTEIGFDGVTFIQMLMSPFEEIFGTWIWFGIWLAFLGLILMGSKNTGLTLIVAICTGTFVTAIFPTEATHVIAVILTLLGAAIVSKAMNKRE